jgi:ABC-2 type transport system ATP-binding protein
LVKAAAVQLDIPQLSVIAPDGRLLCALKDFTFGSGICTLTGPNGVGKSTFLKALAGLKNCSDGSIILDGIDSRTQRRKYLYNLAYQPQNFCAYPELSGLEFLIYFARLRGVRKSAATIAAAYWMTAVGLADLQLRCSAYSQGMLQRLGVAYVLQTTAGLCLLDEPFAGVDPEGRHRLLDLIEAEAGSRMFIICSHNADELIDRGAKQIHIEDGEISWLGEA